MSIITAIRQRLIDSNFVEQFVATRIYEDVAEQATKYPCIVISVVSYSTVMEMQGPTGFANERIQIDVFAETAMDRVKTRDGVRRALNGFRGTVKGIRIDSMVMVNDVSRFIEQADVFIRTVDFSVWYCEES